MCSRHLFILCYFYLVFLLIKRCSWEMSKGRGTRPKFSEQSSALMRKVYCFNCKAFILNSKDQPDEKFLNYHYANKGCSDKSLVFKRKDSVMVTFPPGAHFGMFDSPTNSLYNGDERAHCDVDGVVDSSEDDDDDVDEDNKSDVEVDDEVWSEDEEHGLVEDVLTASDLELLSREECFLGTNHKLKGCDVMYSPIHILKAMATNELKGEDINVIHPSEYIFEIQSKFLNLYEKESVVHGESMKFRNMGNVEGKEDVKAEDLMDLLKFGLNVGLSDANGDELLATLDRILDRHKSPIQLRKTWKSLRLAVDKKFLLLVMQLQMFDILCRLNFLVFIIT